MLRSINQRYYPAMRIYFVHFQRFFCRYFVRFNRYEVPLQGNLLGKKSLVFLIIYFYFLLNRALLPFFASLASKIRQRLITDFFSLNSFLIWKKLSTTWCSILWTSFFALYTLSQQGSHINFCDFYMITEACKKRPGNWSPFLKSDTFQQTL